MSRGRARSISFFVSGKAAPGGSKKAFRNPRTDRIVVIDDSGKAGKAWRKRVREEASKHAPDEPFAGPLHVGFQFRRARPLDHYVGGNRERGVLKPGVPEWPVKRPDVLKLARAAEDALTGILYVDDAQIVTEELHKGFDPEPGVLVYVREIIGGP